MNRQVVFTRQVFIIGDTTALIASFVGAYWLRDRLLGPWYGSMLPFLTYIWLLWVIVPTWLFFLDRFGLQKFSAQQSMSGKFRGIVKSQIMGGLVLFAVVLLTRSLEVSRLFVFCFLAVSAAVLFTDRLILTAALRRLDLTKSLGRRHVVIVNNGSRMEDLLHLLENQTLWKSDVIGFLSLDGTSQREICGKPVLADIAGFSTVAKKYAIDEVIVANPSSGGTELSQLATDCVERGITFRTTMHLPFSSEVKPRIDPLGDGSYLLSLETIPQEPAALLLKRLIDVIGAAVGLALVGFVHLWYRHRVRKESPGPVLFQQERVGQNGRVFTLYKFRTMHLDAEAHLQTLRTKNQMRGHMFKLREDPRVFPSGNLLRRRHFDELPQFWNVLSGEMSIVGTRPPTRDEVGQYRAHHLRRLSMKPGITGLWQVSGNEAVNDFEEVVKLDCKYINSWSPWLDFKIIGRTLLKVMRAEGW